MKKKRKKTFFNTGFGLYHVIGRSGLGLGLGLANNVLLTSLRKSEAGLARQGTTRDGGYHTALGILGLSLQELHD